MGLKNNKEFIFETFDEAIEVHKELFRLLRTYGRVTLADLYNLVGVIGNYTDDKYGWTNLHGSKVEPVEGYINGNWILKLPKIKKLNKKENKNEN